uniref:Uncharacterized protein n=1 Tax=Cannabis sativa TaxID=3483 RepID=A0A803QEN7_CANSA
MAIMSFLARLSPEFDYAKNISSFCSDEYLVHSPASVIAPPILTHRPPPKPLVVYSRHPPPPPLISCHALASSSSDLPLNDDLLIALHKEGDGTQESVFQNQAKTINEVITKAKLVPPPPAPKANELSTLATLSAPIYTYVDNDLAKRLDRPEAQQATIILS